MYDPVRQTLGASLRVRRQVRASGSDSAMQHAVSTATSSFNRRAQSSHRASEFAPEAQIRGLNV